MKVKYLGQQAKSVDGVLLHVGMIEDMSDAVAAKLKEKLGDEIELVGDAPKKVEAAPEPIKPEPLKGKKGAAPEEK